MLLSLSIADSEPAADVAELKERFWDWVDGLVDDFGEEIDEGVKRIDSRIEVTQETAA